MKQQIEPKDPYECWITPCRECVYFDVNNKKCNHPEVLQWMEDEV